jgi:hypothetical protein
VWYRHNPAVMPKRLYKKHLQQNVKATERAKLCLAPRNLAANVGWRLAQ